MKRRRQAIKKRCGIGGTTWSDYISREAAFMGLEVDVMTLPFGRGWSVTHRVSNLAYTFKRMRGNKVAVNCGHHSCGIYDSVTAALINIRSS